MLKTQKDPRASAATAAHAQQPTNLETKIESLQGQKCLLLTTSSFTSTFKSHLSLDIALIPESFQRMIEQIITKEDLKVVFFDDESDIDASAEGVKLSESASACVKAVNSFIKNIGDDGLKKVMTTAVKERLSFLNMSQSKIEKLRQEVKKYGQNLMLLDLEDRYGCKHSNYLEIENFIDVTKELTKTLSGIIKEINSDKISSNLEGLGEVFDPSQAPELHRRVNNDPNAKPPAIYTSERLLEFHPQHNQHNK